MAEEEAERLEQIYTHHKKSAAIQTIFTMAFLFTGISNILISQDLVPSEGPAVAGIIIVDLALMLIALDIGGGNLIRQVRRHVDGDLE